MKGLFFILLAVMFTRGLAEEHIITVYDAVTIKRVENCRIQYAGQIIVPEQPGLFRFTSHEADSVIRIEAPLYNSALLNIRHREKMVVYLQPAQSLADILVTADKNLEMPVLLPAGVSAIEVQKTHPYAGETLANILSKEVGISNKSYGADGQIQGIALRGMAAEQTQVLYDGIPLNSLQLGSADASSQVLGRIENVHIYRGGNPGYGGSGAIAGTINLSPVTPQSQFQISAAQSYSSLKNRNTSVDLHLPFGTMRTVFSGGITKADNDYTLLHNGMDVDLRNRDFKSENVFWRLQYPLTDKIRLDAFIQNYRHKGGASKPFTGVLAEESNRASKSTDNTLSRFKIEQSLSNGKVEYQFYLRNEWNSYKDIAPPANSLHFNQEKGAFSRLRYMPWQSLALHSGVEFAAQKVNSTDAGLHERNRWALFLQGDWRVAGNANSLYAIHFNFSGRYEHIGQSRVLLPGAGISTQYKEWQLFATIGKNYRAPGFNDLYWARLGNPDLQPEKSTNIETGISFKKEVGSYILDMTANFYHTEVSRQIKWLFDGQDWRPRNIAKVTSSGFEFSAGVKPLEYNFDLRLNYTYTDISKTKKEFAGDKTVGNRLPYIPLHSVSSALRYTYHNLRCGASVDFMSFRYKTLENSSNEFLPAQAIGSAWLGYHIPLIQKLKSTIYLHVENLTDKDYQFIAGFPMPPRTYNITLKLSY